MIKVTFMGAGSTVFAKNVLGDCMCTPVLHGLDIALYDIDPVRLEESQKMLDIIYENRWCDLGNLYNVGEVLTGMTSLVTTGKNSFASMIASKESSIEATLEQINEAFLENE